MDFGFVIVIDACYCTGEGENFTEGGQDSGVNLSRGWNEESDDNEYATEDGHTHCENQLDCKATLLLGF
jgi:hypothetical protein